MTAEHMAANLESWGTVEAFVEEMPERAIR